MRWVMVLLVNDIGTDQTGLGPVYYKTFYGRILRIFVISCSVCPWQAFPALPANIRQGWKSMPGTNILDYY